MFQRILENTLLKKPFWISKSYLSSFVKKLKINRMGIEGVMESLQSILPRRVYYLCAKIKAIEKIKYIIILKFYINTGLLF